MSTVRYESYRSSDIPWIGEVPSTWRTVPLFSVLKETKLKNSGLVETNLLSLSYGRIVRKDIDAIGGLLPESFETYQIVEPDQLIFRFTDLQNDQRSLRSARVRERGIITSAYAAARPEGIDARFIEYLMRAYDTTKVFYGLGGGVRQSLKFSDVARLPVLLPPWIDQVAIVDFLDRETARIDTLIEEQQRLIEMLRERRVAAVERSIAMLDWTVPFKSVATLIQTGPFGSQLKSDEYEDGGTPIINPSHMVAGEIVPDPRVAVSAPKAQELGRHALMGGDLICARRGDLGRCAVVDESSAGYLCGTGSALVRVDPDRIDAPFAALVFSSRRNRDALALASVGSTMDNLNSDIIGALRIPLPTLAEQRELVATVNEQTTKIDELIAETERFIELSRERRAALITAAVTGQIDVREVA
ncbi:restriction endonuclease subunit S [Janibacter terrae]|uniref:restriction endonuclease subunit S n=1 Tax=Janibacter terrae TaxID=103817 RepID=UPI00382D1320